MQRRLTLIAAALASAALVAACASTTPADYAAEKPLLDLKTYFNGDLTAHGLFDDGVLDEQFVYSDGEKQQRIWRLKKLADGKYTGTAGDVIGTAQGQSAGNAFQWSYTLRLPVDGKTYDVQFDDWMYLMDDRVMLNKAVMSKFGVRLGEVTLSFYKS